MVTGSWDYTAKLWAAGLKIETLRVKEHIAPNLDANYSPDGNYIFTIDNQGIILIHDALAGGIVAGLEGFNASFNPVNNQQVLTHDGTNAVIWDWARNEPVRIITDAEAGISAAAFTPDGQQLLTIDNEGVARVWDAGSEGEPTAAGSHAGGPVLDVLFGENGTFVATQEDNSVGIWDLNVPDNGALMLEGHTDDVITAVFSSDGKYVYTGGYDNTIRKWDAGTGESLLVMTGHTGRILDVDVSLDGSLVASASADTTVRVWDAETGKEIYNYQGNNEDANSVAFNPDGTRVLTASSDKTSKEFTIDLDMMLQIASEYELRDLTKEECRRYLNRDNCFLNLFASAPSGGEGPSVPGGGSETPELRSGAGSTPVTLIIVNDTDFDVDVFWIDFDGFERQYYTLAPGDEVEQGTYNTHVWRARDADGNTVMDYTATDDPKQTWEILGADVNSGAGTGTVTATEVPAPSTDGAFYTEEFDGDLAAWEAFMANGSASQVEFGLDGGSLFVSLSQEEDKIPYFYLVNPENEYSSVQLEATTTNYGNNTNGVSLVCNYNGTNWYEFTVSNAGLYSINYYDPAATSTLGYIQLAGGGSSAIKTGKAANTYRAVCNGNELALYINDTQVKTITDTIYNLAGGRIGIGVSSPQTLPVDVSFEYLTVGEP